MAAVRVLMAAMAMALVVELAMAANYDVGDKNGWSLGVDYTKWVAHKTFFPGDNITFAYSTPAHNVVEVNAADYAACSASSAISTSSSGKTVVSLGGVGKRYFICSRPSHCTQGMKVEIDVLASKSPSPGSSPSGTSASPASPPAPSAAASSTNVQNKVALGLAVLAFAAVGRML